jgi:hypothetical protein
MKTRTYLFAILALCLIGSAIAAENESYVIVELPTIEPTPVPTLIPYISQGDTVYVGDTVDLSGVLAPYPGMAYWDGFDMYDSVPRYNLTMPDNKRSYYKFYIDPEIFGNRLGRWYKYNGKFEKQGNNRLFTVMPAKMSNSTLTFPNGTSINLSEVVQQTYTSHLINPAPLLPEKHISDYVVAKGDELVLPEGNFRVWVFGRVSGIYANEGHTITKEQISSLDGGNYDIVFQYPGSNTIYDSTCDTKDCKTLIPGLYGQKPVNVYGYQPSVVYDKLKGMLIGTDDTLVEYDLQVENPYITIHQADETEYQTHSALNVRGYSNVANGTKITVSLDEKNAYYKDIPKIQTQTTAVRTSSGNLSYYSVNVPFNYDDLAADARNHTLTARTELGGIVQKDFKISLMPADSYKPNATLKYIEDRNPFVPTPTPEIVTIERTKIVTQTITIPVTPTNETVYEQQRKAQDDITKGWVSLAVTAIVALVVLIGLGWYALRVWRRL